MAYAAFHASRKPPSIVKSVLGPDIQSLNATIHAQDVKTDFNTVRSNQNPDGISAEVGWVPFSGPRGPHRLGELDLSFLLAYAIGMYFAGHIGDSFDLRLFLTIGMVGSGILVIIFGFGYFLNVHSFAFFMIVQILCGLFQSIGWPCVVAVMANWFGKSRRGLIMGLWSSHTSFGNILGSLVASSVLGLGWGWAFVLPGIFILVVAILIYMFLVECPESIGLELPEKEVEMSVEGVALVNSEKNDVVDEVIGSRDQESSDAIGFIEAWRLPGVAHFAFCLFFSKLVAYTFLYWLPFYLRHTAIAGKHVTHKTAGILSTIFDVGGVVGGILAGFLSDMIEARAVSSLLFLLMSVPALIIYRVYGSVSMLMNIVLMFISGLLVNGPYSLITTAVSADLGTQSSIKGNSRALATVSAIIDGTGSIGAAIGPLLAGYASTRGWNSVFLLLILSLMLAGLSLVNVAKKEIKAKMNEGKWLSFN